MTFQNSQTCINLMRAFAGESQARNRYTLAAKAAREQQYPVLEQVFLFTAQQELTHAEQFFSCLQKHGVTNVEIQGGYPVDPVKDLQALLDTARQNELEEFDPVYPEFARIAASEGYEREAFLFRSIAAIERSHADRFAMFAKLMLEERLFSGEENGAWLCLHCGHIHEGSGAPTHCPVCGAVQGYFIRQSCAPYTCAGGENVCMG
ncbi:MAG: rubrerythrin family protein [Oscillospiraceae bacterium]|nr:rubrerythrin family protein [Oscillospiraceae bacterium]